ncbi:helix-turn-helix domain-containing protein [Solihabitans fulvus]|uniref:helix-turn-helix domain-containing protein n=1 Tax=Solihabitans fulvus TaxID=1892852 RepID=UPI001661DCB5|nr:helix-turn-helix transcriptional regulator [Solihabitans fulvus]
MVAENSPTVLRRWIAFTLRRLRQEAGKSRRDVVDLAGCTLAHVSHIETGRNLPAPLECDALLEFYGVPERTEFFRELLHGARKGRDWWTSKTFLGAVPSWFDLYLGLESSSVAVRSFDALVVPGLFQTADYARAVIEGSVPELAGNEVRRRVELRLARQQLLRREPDPLAVSAVIDESALRRLVGSPAVLLAQLARLAELAELSTIDIRVLPANVGAHTGLDGTFTMMIFPHELPGYPGAVYVETRLRGHYYEEPAEIAEYHEVFTRLRTQAGSPSDAPATIARIAKEIVA